MIPADTHTSTSDQTHPGSPSNLFSLEKHLGGEILETPQKATKSVPKKIDVVNQQPPKPSQQNNPEQTTLQTKTQTQTQQTTISESVIETVVEEFVLVTESALSVSSSTDKSPYSICWLWRSLGISEVQSFWTNRCC